MKKALFYSLIIIFVLVPLTGCGVTHKYPICPDAELVGPCDDMVMPVDLGDSTSVSTISIGSQYPVVTISVVDGGWIGVSCSPYITIQELEINSRFSLVNNNRQEAGSCQISAQTWPSTTNHHINVEITFYSQ